MEKENPKGWKQHQGKNGKPTTVVGNMRCGHCISPRNANWRVNQRTPWKRQLAAARSFDSSDGS